MQARLRKLIKTKRLKKGLTQEQMAHMLNYKSKATYNMLENGPTIITTEHLKTISDILKINRKELVSIFFDNDVHETGTNIKEHI